MAPRTIEVTVRRRLFHATALALPLGFATPLSAQTQDDPDLDINFAQPDFTLVSLPTTLRLPKFKSAFRVTHRFTRPLGDGDFGDLARISSASTPARRSASIPLRPHAGQQVGIHRTTDRTIEFFAQYEVVAAGNWLPVAISALATMDGTDNFTDSYSPGSRRLISRTLGEHGALYLEPIWVNNTNRLPSEVVEDNDTFMVGMGARIRVRPDRSYLRSRAHRACSGNLTGVGPDQLGLEKRAGGNMCFS